MSGGRALCPARLDAAVGHLGLLRAARPWVDAGLLEPADLAVVEALVERTGRRDPEVEVVLALAHGAVRLGHVGYELRADPGPLGVQRPCFGRSAADLAKAVATHGLVTVEREGDPKALEAARRPFRIVFRGGLAPPLVLTDRMWRHQQVTAQRLAALAASEPTVPVDPAAARQLAVRLLPGEAGEVPRRAVVHAAGCPLTIVTGGPGTGKTYTVLRLLAVLLAAGGGARLRIRVAAPTGKAAHRLTESLAESCASLPVPEEVRAALAGLRGETVHRLVGMGTDGRVRHGPDRPIPADVVVVDEVSMVDLVLMRRLVEGLEVGPEDGRAARLVLLGDPDQLASVDAGTVLSDLVDPEAGLADHVVTLEVAHRFKDAPEVAALAGAIRRGRVDEAMKRLTADRGGGVGGSAGAGAPAAPAIRHVSAAHGPTADLVDALVAPWCAPGGFVPRLREAVSRAGSASVPADAAVALLAALDRYRVLAALRRGPLGSEVLAGLLQGRIAALAGVDRAGVSEDLAVGTVVLVTRNDPRVGLRNGDVGLVLPGPSGVEVGFADLREGVRRVSAAALPPWEPGAAMTVHKAQGSQFPHVAFVAGARDAPLLTRELVYTAVTRARRRLDWYGDPAVLRRALGRRVQRASDLARVLWDRLGPARPPGGDVPGP